MFIYKEVKDGNSGTDAEVAGFEVTSIDLEELKSYNLPFVIDFGSDSCQPCKAFEPVLIQINEEMQGKAIVRYVDVWKYTSAADNFPVQVIPTQVFYTADGKPFVPSEELASEIDFTLYSDETTEEHLFTVHEGGLTLEQMYTILAEMGVE